MARDSFPRQQARTQYFSLGTPGSFAIAGDGARVLFLRTKAGDDPVACLWTIDTSDGVERLLFDPRDLAPESETHLTQEELDRRQRMRERQTGVTSFAIDEDARLAVFALGDRLVLLDVATGDHQEVATAGAPFDPRLDPTGARIAYVADRAVHIIDLPTGRDLTVASDPDPDVHWGVAEFVAAEEMDRRRGHWWSPDGRYVAAARVDERPVLTWHIASPIDPSATPRAVRYPQAGTANAIVTMSVFSLDGARTDIVWDVDAFPYLARVSWTAHGPLTLLVQSRDQRTTQVLTVDDEAGGTKVVREDRDPAWIHLMHGVPAWLPGGRLLTTIDRDDTRRLAIDGEPITPDGLQVEHVIEAGDDVVFTATIDPTEMHVWRYRPSSAELDPLTTDAGVWTCESSSGVMVFRATSLEEPLPSFALLRNGEPVSDIASHAELPTVVPKPRLLTVGTHELRCALLVPGGEEPTERLPVLMDPYGGPGFSRVVKSRRAFLESQWWADQGFAVLVADGRGTPNRGTESDRSILNELGDHMLQDQVDALQAVAEEVPFLDVTKVGIRGWSGGGYLACLAVLRRPDVFHAAVAGAPVTDLRFYDTHYMERYLGDPNQQPEVYARNSVIGDAAGLDRPLLLIHGLADDNVYITHTLALSKALMEAGRPHTVLPLSGITHMPTDEHVAENLLLLELDFLKNALGIGRSP